MLDPCVPDNMDYPPQFYTPITVSPPAYRWKWDLFGDGTLTTHTVKHISLWQRIIRFVLLGSRFTRIENAIA